MKPCSPLKKSVVTKIHLENCHVKMLYVKLKLHVLKKDHHYKNQFLALAGVAQWIERQTANQRVASLIPSQGTCLACGPGLP